MVRPSHREKLLVEGLRVVHEKGFGAASVRDIVQAAGVPQGSFTNHFVSKEAFGLEVLERYVTDRRQVVEATLRNETLAPLDRLRAYLAANRAHIAEGGMRNGCLFGNFSAEVADQSEAIRLRLVAVFAEVRRAVAACLAAARATGAIEPGADPDALASLIVSAMQGAILIAKTERSTAALDRLEATLFTAILR